MGNVHSTQLIGGLPGAQSRSEVPTLLVSNNRIGDQYDITYGLNRRRDATKTYTFPEGKAPPRQIDLRVTTFAPYFEPFDQHNSGSCTAQTVKAAFMCFERAQSKEKASFVEPSALFIYYYARVIDEETRSTGTITDTGTSVVSSLMSAQRGIASVETWPFDRSLVNTKPSVVAQRDALHRRVTRWVNLDPSLTNIKNALASGTAVIMSFDVTRSMDEWFLTPGRQYNTGHMLTRNTITQFRDIVGGHAVLLVGYDDKYLGKGAFIARNSWGPLWGDRGHFYIEYGGALYPDLHTDFHAITGICTNRAGFCVNQSDCTYDSVVCDVLSQ